MTSSSTSPSWNDDQIDELLTKFYAQEIPSELRDASHQDNRVENTGACMPSKRVWKRKWFLTSAAAIVGLPVVGWLWYGSHDSSDTMTNSEASAEPNTGPKRTHSLADHARESTPVETPRRIEPARLTEPPILPSSEMPEWEIQVFPIEERQLGFDEESPAIAEPAARRNSR